MHKDYSHIAVVLDRSGSMDSIKDDTIGGFNSFLKSQKEVEGKATFFLAQFDNQYDILQNNKDIDEVEELSYETFQPRGMTALYDAIGRTIISVGDFLSNIEEEERPAKVFFVVITDGMENASNEFTSSRVKEMIDEQQNKYSWKFIFIGSDINAINEAHDLGFAKGSSLHFADNSIGTRSVYNSMTKNMSSYRDASVNLSADLDFFNEEDVKLQEDARTK